LLDRLLVEAAVVEDEADLLFAMMR